MGLFSRSKPGRADLAPDIETTDEVGLDGGIDGDSNGGFEGDPAQAESREGGSGPFDSSELSDTSDYLDLGAILLRGQPGLELRLEVNDQEQQITGVTAVLGESAVQLQAFAAPRSEGVWIDIRNEIAASITDAGGTAEVITGEFGQELMTRMPQSGPDGRTVFMPARFVGVDGPRWFLRAVVSGRAAIEPEAAVAIHDIIRSTVIERGDEARPPRELLPLRLPESQTPAADDEPVEGEVPAAPRVDDLKPFERGPEITERR